jgi:K+-transporting ATPase KdpF subunit
MQLTSAIMIGICVLVGIYLFYALLRPEKF